MQLYFRLILKRNILKLHTLLIYIFLKPQNKQALIVQCLTQRVWHWKKWQGVENKQKKPLSILYLFSLENKYKILKVIIQKEKLVKI